MAPAKDWSYYFSYEEAIDEKRLSEVELLRTSVFLLGLMQNNRVVLHKNRYGVVKGQLTLNETIEILTDIIVRVKFDGRMDLFQEGMKKQLKEAITSIVNSEKINEGIEDGKRGFRSKSTSNGVNPSRLQRALRIFR